MPTQTLKNPPNWPAIHYTIFYSNKQKHINQLKTFLKNQQPPPLYQTNLIPLNADKRIREYYSPHLVVLNSSIKRDPKPLCQQLNIKIIQHSIDKNYLNEHPQPIPIFFYKNNFFWTRFDISIHVLEDYLIIKKTNLTDHFTLNVSNSNHLILNKFSNNRPTKSL